MMDSIVMLIKKLIEEYLLGEKKDLPTSIKLYKWKIEGKWVEVVSEQKKVQIKGTRAHVS